MWYDDPRVILYRGSKKRTQNRVNTQYQPHASGDYSKDAIKYIASFRSAPRQWGLLPCERCTITDTRISPTPVGITLLAYMKILCHNYQPHASGDYSSTICSLENMIQSAPRQWGLLHFHYNEYLHSFKW